MAGGAAVIRAVIEIAIRRPFIRAQKGAWRDFAGDDRGQRLGFGVGDRPGPHNAVAALHHAEHDGLVRSLCRPILATLPAADPRLVKLDVAR
jgi:hypothetical protein